VVEPVGHERPLKSSTKPSNSRRPTPVILQIRGRRTKLFGEEKRQETPYGLDQRPLVVYHGTDENAAANILKNGVDPAAGIALSDFGPGFYVTSSLWYAKNHADQKVLRSAMSLRAAVLIFDVDRDLVGNLDDHLTFVCAGDEFHDFVAYNHGGGLNHARAGGAPYDLVYGPISQYPERSVHLDDRDQICDQICFLNRKALGSLKPPGNPIYGAPRFLS
jgi:hypothetical protein